MMIISSTDKDNSVVFLAKRSPPVGIYFQLADRRELFEGIVSAGGGEIAAIRDEAHGLRLSKVSDSFKKRRRCYI